MKQNEYLESIAPHYNDYQELHVHTEASMRDAVCTVDEIVECSKEQGRNCFAITDHGNMLRLFHGIKARAKDEQKNLKSELTAMNVPDDEVAKIMKTLNPTDSIKSPPDCLWPWIDKYPDAFIRAAKKSLSFISGVEMYFQPVEDKEDGSAHHLILYAKDWTGQKALFKLHNLAQLNKSKKGMPRTTWAALERFCGEGGEGHGHVVATSACVGGYISNLLLQEWNLSEKQQSVQLKHFNGKIYNFSANDLDDAKKKLEAQKNRQAELKTLISLGKKHQKKDYINSIAKKEAHVDKLLASIKALQKKLADHDDTVNYQLTFDKSSDDSVGEKLRTKLRDEQAKYQQALADLESLEQALEEANRIIPSLSAYVQELNDITTQITVTKNLISSIESELRPLMRAQEQIAELEKEKASLGDIYEQAKEAALRMQNIFGVGNFFIELHRHNIGKEDFVRPQLYRLIQETHIPPTVANDVHFARPSDKHKRDLIYSMRYNKNVAEEENREGMAELYFKTNEQMHELFSDEIGQEGIRNTARIAEMCSGLFYEKGMHLPEFDAKSAGFNSAKDYLENFCHRMIPTKYNINALSPEDRAKKLDEIEKRLQYELDIIEKMGFSSYIAIVQDFIFFARTVGSNKTFAGMNVGPGRGSAAGSIVCYLSDITDIDPLRYNLLFERFLNPERVSMPKLYWASIVNPTTQGCAA